MLQCLRKIKNFTDCIQLATSLVLSKLDYYDTVFYPLPEYFADSLQPVQYTAAAFVLNCYVKNMPDITSLEENRKDWQIPQVTHKALHNTDWPLYLKLEEGIFHNVSYNFNYATY